MYVNDHNQYFEASLTQNNSPMANETIIFTINSVNYTKSTNDKGIAKLQINLNPRTYTITTTFKDLVNVNKLFVRDSNTIFVAEGSTNDEIQKIIDTATKGSTLEFIGKSYADIHLTVNNQLNLVSYSGAVLNGIGNKPVILISGNGASGTKVLGLNFVGGSAGIKVSNIANNVEISNNIISNSNEGIVLDNIWDCKVENNTILNIVNNGIRLKDASNTNVVNNTLNGNKNGIYFDVGNDNTNILNNTITKSSEWGINLQKSGEHSLIEGNTIKGNQNGILLNCNADELVIQSNNVEKNKENGINIGSDYKKTDYNEDAVIRDNVVVSNGHMNMLASESSYLYHKFDSNWAGSGDRVFSAVCAKIQMPEYGLSIEQTGSGTLELKIGKDGSGASNLPSATVSVSFDGGKTFKAVQIKNGKAVLHVSNADGNVIIRTSGPAVSVNLKDYVPYEEPSNPTTPNTPENPSDSNTENGNGTVEGNGQGSEGAGDTINVGNVEGIASSVASAVATLSASESSSSSEATANQQESVAASETSETSSETSSESQSQSVAKSITVDEALIKIAGVGAIILLIIVVIGIYYREDIEKMLNTKKGI